MYHMHGNEISVDPERGLTWYGIEAHQSASVLQGHRGHMLARCAAQAHNTHEGTLSYRVVNMTYTLALCGV